MIIGASPEKDGAILHLTDALYRKFDLKRVYFSSYVPLNEKTDLLPQKPAGLMREHRLYQADWLLRFYGFEVDEFIKENENLNPLLDPKCDWAFRHTELFPIEINTASDQMLVRTPGIGLKSAYKIIKARRFGNLNFTDLIAMKIPLKRAVHFITVNGKYYGAPSFEKAKGILTGYSEDFNYSKLSLFSDNETALSVISGEL